MIKGPLDVKCPKCGAARGEICIRVTEHRLSKELLKRVGEPLRRMHNERFRVADTDRTRYAQRAKVAWLHRLTNQALERGEIGYAERRFDLTEEARLRAWLGEHADLFTFNDR